MKYAVLGFDIYSFIVVCPCSFNLVSYVSLRMHLDPTCSLMSDCLLGLF